MTPFTIVQLYPDELGVAGDRGNTLALAKRLTDAGFDHELVGIHRDVALPDSADLVLVGGGPLAAMRAVHADLMMRAQTLRDWAGDGVVFFAYGSGAELLGRTITTVAGDVIEGVGIFPFTSRRVAKRNVGYVVADIDGTQVVGFEDNASEWTPEPESTPFARVTMSSAVTSFDGSVREGVRVGASVATLLGGPLLPLNPAIAFELIVAAAARRGIKVGRPAEGDLDRYAERARAVMVENAAHVFSRI